MPIITNNTAGVEVELIPDSVQSVGQVIPQIPGVSWADWNVPGINIPLWFIIELFCILLLFVGVAYWAVRVRAMSDVSAFRKPSGQGIRPDQEILVWKLGNNRRLTIQSLTYSAGHIDYQDVDPNNHEMWSLNGKGQTVIIGGKSGVVVSENYSICRDIACESALITVINDYNATQPDVRKKIHNFEDYQEFGFRELIARYPDGIPAFTYRVIDPKSSDSFMPPGNTPSFYGSLLTEMAKNLLQSGKDTEGFWGKYAPLMMCGVFAMIAFIGAIAFPL